MNRTTPVTARHRYLGGALGGADPAQTASLSQTRPVFKTGRPM
jgi:hypothetical protein